MRCARGGGGRQAEEDDEGEEESGAVGEEWVLRGSACCWCRLVPIGRSVITLPTAIGLRGNGKLFV